MLAALVASVTLTATTPQDTAHIVLVATTDIHGHATDWDYAHDRPFAGGVARVAGIVDSLKTRYPGQVIVADAGDLIQGDPFATYFSEIKPRDPHPLMEAMNLAGYDIATLGNHEFDRGLSPMRRALAAAAFPYVSGNIYTLSGDTLLFPAFAVLPRAGVRVGVAGFTTPGVMVWNRDQVRGRIRVERIPAAGSKVLAAMRRQADLSVVLVHSGMDGSASYDTSGIGSENAAAEFGRLGAKPDLVIVGHSHREMRDSVLNGVHFVQPKPFGAGVAVIHLSLVNDQGRWRIARIRSDLVSTASVKVPDRVAQRLGPAHRAVLAWIRLPIGQTTAEMPAAAARAEPTPILNLINGVQRKRTGAQLSATPAFDLSAGLDSGVVTVGQVVALYPFDNTLKAVRISGRGLKEYLEHSARYYHADPVGRIAINDSVPGYNFDIVAGARYEIDLRQPIGARIRNLSVSGRTVRPEDSFTLALNSYRQSGAGGYTMLRDAPVVYDKGENIRDLLIEEIRSRRTINPAEYGAREWRIVPEPLEAEVKSLFRLPPKPAGPDPADTVLFRVLATADLHGALLPKLDEDGEPKGGLANVAALMDSLTGQCGCSTVRLDAGDALQGTVIANLTRGRAVVDGLNAIQLGAAVPGEHDLEWSVDTLQKRMSESRFPWVAANVFDSATGKRVDWITPYRILEGGGFKVAVVGYISSDSKAGLKPPLTAGLRFGDGAVAIHDVLKEVRAQRPDLTILLAHAGAACQGPVCTGELIRLVDGLEPKSVDLVIAGETPLISTRVAGVPIISAGSRGSALAVADLVRTASGAREVRTSTEAVVPGAVTQNQAVADLVETYRRRANELADRIVATVKFPVPRSGDQNRLGALIAESRRNLLRADVGLVANENIRADLPAGPVTYGQLFEIQPSQNALVRVTLNGGRLQEALEHSIDAAGGPRAHVAGITVRYDPRRQPGRRIQRVELANGQRLRRDRVYTLATDDFLTGGGAGYGMLKGLPTEPGGTLDVDGLVAYLRRLPQPVAPIYQPGFISSRR